MAQQAIEIKLKYVISIKTGDLPWGHDIGKLVVIAKKYEVEVPDEIVKNAAMYTSWEVMSLQGSVPGEGYEGSIIL